MVYVAFFLSHLPSLIFLSQIVVGCDDAVSVYEKKSGNKKGEKRGWNVFMVLNDFRRKEMSVGNKKVYGMKNCKRWDVSSFFASSSFFHSFADISVCQLRKILVLDLSYRQEIFVLHFVHNFYNFYCWSFFRIFSF